MKTDIVQVLPGKLGGVVTIAQNLVAYRNREAFSQHVILTNNLLDVDTRFDSSLDADSQTRFDYELPLENLHAVLRRLASRIPPGPGVLVAHDVLELLMMARYPVDRTVVQILHGDHDYYYDLAAKYQTVIDVFVAYSKAMFERLREVLPNRRDDIVHVPYGIPIPTQSRGKSAGALRVVYCGRLENGQKGIFDLPLIDRQLRSLKAEVEWTVIGDGPDRDELHRRWSENPKVRWIGPCSNQEVIDRYREQDVFVLPTRREGFPVSLVEAMASGLVPVVSDIESGVPEIVDHGATGYRRPLGDIAGFAAAIASLASTRERLDVMSRAARDEASRRFDIRDAVGAYEDLFSRWEALRRPDKGPRRLHTGSRLDRPWLPNAFVYRTRRGIRWLKRMRNQQARSVPRRENDRF
jgi:glycosyltransferase involved in cell wall biosynthesis